MCVTEKKSIICCSRCGRWIITLFGAWERCDEYRDQNCPMFRAKKQEIFNNQLCPRCEKAAILQEQKEREDEMRKRREDEKKEKERRKKLPDVPQFWSAQGNQ